jgi:drug/metabolite transporter (DMT)-like permease
LLNLTICHLGGLMFVPQFLRRPPPSLTQLQVARVHIVALLFTFILMGYNYAWLLSARFQDAALTNAIFQTSIALVYMVSVWLFSEPLTLPRVVGVAFSIIGSVLASGAASETGGDIAGVALAVCAGVGVAVYQVMFRYLYGNAKNDPSFLAFFGAWVSVFHLIVMLPLTVLADLFDVEDLEIPQSRATAFGTIISAAIASAVNAMYLCIVMWGSPMLLPCTSALSVPCMVGLDALLHGVFPGRTAMLGHLMVVASVALIMQKPGLPVMPPTDFHKIEC